ncbi:MAG: undecaprenyl-diphosphate phosphatase [Planctomycetota bacterium]
MLAVPVGDPIGLLSALWLGLVEGATEFLPVSSTGHLIAVERLLGIRSGAAENAFTVAIQIGAITAILAIYGRRLWRSAAEFSLAKNRPNLLLQILVAAMPAAILGLLLDDWIDAHLFSARVVAIAMALGGVLLLGLERLIARRGAPGRELPEVSYRTAFAIGLFQCLALIPGTSRSAAMIAGALLLGLSRTAAAEFSFLVGLPILYGAGALSLLKHHRELAGQMLWPLLVGSAVSFLAALVVVRPFVAFLRRRTFAPFAWYRLAAGIALLALGMAGAL